MAKTETITLRVNSELRARMETVRQAMPYRPSLTTILERGIVLALEEIERLTITCQERP